MCDNLFQQYFIQKILLPQNVQEAIMCSYLIMQMMHRELYWNNIKFSPQNIYSLYCKYEACVQQCDRCYIQVYFLVTQQLHISYLFWHFKFDPFINRQLSSRCTHIIFQRDTCTDKAMFNYFECSQPRAWQSL